MKSFRVAARHSPANVGRVSDVTRVLEAVQHGDPAAAKDLLPLVYEELRRLARSKMAQQAAGHTLQPTALVHEAWLKLGDQRFENRAHFFGAAAEAMRRILVDRARRKHRDKRGNGAEHVDVDEIEIAAPTENADELLRVHEVLDCFAAEDPQKAELVRLRFFLSRRRARFSGYRSVPRNGIGRMRARGFSMRSSGTKNRRRIIRPAWPFSSPDGA